MDLDVAQELAALRKMTTGGLRSKYAQVFGETTSGRHREWLVKRIIWRLQALAEGDLTERARQRAAELANDADIRMFPPRDKSKPLAPTAQTAAPTMRDNQRLPLPGTILTHTYKNQTYQVKVLQKGLEFEGQIYKSLSAVAKAITGQHCNGYHFFRLTRKGASA